MKNKENIINLEDYRVQGAKVFTGRDRGLFVRNQSQIDQIETKFDKIEIIIPNNVYSINPSFFEELFFNVVNKLGKLQFLNKFTFTNLGEYNYNKPLNEAIERILRTKTAIG
jgi:hypothetical protein